MKKINLIALSLLLLAACQNDTKKEPEKEKKSTEKSIDKEKYTKEGKKIAQATFKAFVGHIKQKSHEGGLPAVVAFCNENAMKLTDSMAHVYGVKIKRTSHKLRNPKNAPDTAEKEVLEEYLDRIKKGEKPSPVIEQDSIGNIHFYAPIFIKHDCLKCHGEPGKEIPEPIYQLIKEKYPQDQATGFKLGDLRGIWDITFPQK